MAISYNKREQEKKKQSKRLEKQKRKEERKATAGSGSLDDMIAYVDENGVISSTPPDASAKTKIELEDILVSTPKQEYMEPVINRGRVDYFVPDKGYGFIKDAQSGEKYFFHISNAPQGICEGNKVTFDLERGQKGLNAVNISIELPEPKVKKEALEASEEKEVEDKQEEI